VEVAQNNLSNATDTAMKAANSMGKTKK